MSEFVDPRAAPGRPATPVSVSADGLRKAWAADRDQRFTFAVLRELAVAAQSGDDAAVRAIVERTLNERERPVEWAAFVALLARGLASAIDPDAPGDEARMEAALRHVREAALFRPPLRPDSR